MCAVSQAELVRERFGGGEGEEDVMERQDVCQYLEVRPLHSPSRSTTDPARQVFKICVLG